ncbi:uncharacterized protein V2V93DRAFT_373046 [Kockiozyma suomiensis]|uniref:uncharacterized protein n=1 Tax=Kockiozyma suomiensis TaxID=1337062 RepID=UPI003343ED49
MKDNHILSTTCDLSDIRQFELEVGLAEAQQSTYSTAKKSTDDIIAHPKDVQNRNGNENQISTQLISKNEDNDCASPHDNAQGHAESSLSVSDNAPERYVRAPCSRRDNDDCHHEQESICDTNLVVTQYVPLPPSCISINAENAHQLTATNENGKERSSKLLTDFLSDRRPWDEIESDYPLALLSGCEDSDIKMMDGDKDMGSALRSPLSRKSSKLVSVSPLIPSYADTFPEMLNESYSSPFPANGLQRQSIEWLVNQFPPGLIDAIHEDLDNYDLFPMEHTHMSAFKQEDAEVACQRCFSQSEYVRLVHANYVYLVQREMSYMLEYRHGPITRQVYENAGIFARAMARTCPEQGGEAA